MPNLRTHYERDSLDKRLKNAKGKELLHPNIKTTLRNALYIPGPIILNPSKE